MEKITTGHHAEIMDTRDPHTNGYHIKQNSCVYDSGNTVKEGGKDGKMQKTRNFSEIVSPTNGCLSKTQTVATSIGTVTQEKKNLMGCNC